MGFKDLFKKKQTQQIGPKKKILILEDNRQTAQTMKDLLDSDGFDTTLTFEVPQAVAVVGEQKFDLIITDLLIPESTGFDFLKILKERKNKTPVIALTNLGRDDNEKKVRELGVVDFMAKTDVPLEKLSKKIKKILNTN